MCQPAQVALQTNLGEAMAVVANGLEWTTGRSGDRSRDGVLQPGLPMDESAVARRRADLGTETGPSTPIEAIEAVMTDRTRVVAVSHVEFLNGYRHDMVALGQLCADRNILLAVDATQSLGVLPIDAPLWQADVVAAHGYKWMMAMHGIAVLYVSARAMERIAPTMPGRQSVTGGFESLDFALDWHPDARRYRERRSQLDRRRGRRDVAWHRGGDRNRNRRLARRPRSRAICSRDLPSYRSISAPTSIQRIALRS